MAGGDQEFGRVRRVRRAVGAGVAGDARVALAVGGGHGDFDDRALRDARLSGRFRRGGMGGPEDEVAVGAGRGVGAVGECSGLHIAGGVRIADGSWRARGGGGRWGPRCGRRCLRGLRGCGGGRGDKAEQAGGAEEMAHGEFLWVLPVWMADFGSRIHEEAGSLGE